MSPPQETFSLLQFAYLLSGIPFESIYLSMYVV